MGAAFPQVVLTGARRNLNLDAERRIRRLAGDRATLGTESLAEEATTRISKCGIRISHFAIRISQSLL
jgi:hypothetical protein